MKMKYVLTLLVMLGLAASAQADLRGYWDFETVYPAGTFSGIDFPTTLDSSTYGNHGGLFSSTGSGLVPQQISGGAPTGSYALEFSQDYGSGRQWSNVAVNKDASIEYLGSQWTIALWIRHDVNDPAIIGQDGGGGSGYSRVVSCPNYEIEMGVNSWEYDYFWPYNGGSWDTDIGKSYFAQPGGSLGTWYHLALTFDGTTLTKYLNGQIAYQSDANAGNLLPDTWSGYSYEVPLRFGVQCDPLKDHLIGALDDIAIWGDAYLDQCGVLALWCGQDTPLTVATVPEPVTLSLLSLGGLALLRRRK